MGNHMETQSKNVVHDFIVDPSQEKLMHWIFQHHPETAVKFKLQNQQLRTTYMNILLGIINTLYYKPLHDLSESQLSKASKDLSDLTQVGFNLQWLRLKLRKVCFDRKNHRVSEVRIGELEKQVKKLEVMMSDVKAGLEKEKAKLKNP
ncbi:PREDICTED: MATH domain and coiled-coil domain-containing protein At2g42465 [Camelina sativa]|uniref:MATH domain and coiled-coil domain-containing protein At2g42465 n=1 Tax=Camelina sativa TaxID=90675 RepID=A0ABM0VHV5_CAMSA|nr:PREDICTED: MATH domain and coiled-coil domain-containing protein At2g42465 [Camelina sativa]